MRRMQTPANIKGIVGCSLFHFDVCMLAGCLRNAGNPSSLWTAIRLAWDFRNATVQSPWKIIDVESLLTEFNTALGDADKHLKCLSKAAKELAEQSDQTLELLFEALESDCPNEKHFRVFKPYVKTMWNYAEGWPSAVSDMVGT
jgi:hypothetical protein